MKQNLYNFNENFCNYSVSKAPKSKDFYDSHIHNNYELLFFFDGDADFIINGSIYHLQKNDLLLIKPFDNFLYFALINYIHRSVPHKAQRRIHDAPPVIPFPATQAKN